MAKVVREFYINGLGCVRIIRMAYHDTINTPNKQVPFKGGCNYIVTLNWTVYNGEVHACGTAPYRCNTVAEGLKYVEQHYGIDVEANERRG